VKKNSLFISKNFDQLCIGFEERDEIHQHGRYYTPDDLYRKVTGNAISEKPLLDYLEA